MFDITDVRPIIQNLISEYPDRTNPKDDGGYCLYDDGNGNRCIIGEVLHELGLPVPDDNRVDPIVQIILDDEEVYRFTDKAINYMKTVQESADGVLGDPSEPWGTINEDAIYREIG